MREDVGLSACFDKKMADDIENNQVLLGQESENDDTCDLPSAIIITNLTDTIFEQQDQKDNFEETFREFDREVTFQYLHSFRRARACFSSPALAANARIHLHETEVCGNRVKCYFAQPKSYDGNISTPSLLPPVPPHNFLISPPASPPVGWEPIPEAEPIINYDLLAALAKLAPGQAHELHPATQEHPSIVVHICEDTEGYALKMKARIQQTRCPDRTT